MRTRRPLIALLAAAAVIVGGTVTGATAVAAPTVTPAPGGYVPAPVSWVDCSADYAAGFECGTVAVPLDWAHPSGTKITLALTRLQHTSSDYQGVMLTNPGGPGGSGLTLPVLKYYVPNGGGDGYDWIGFDPRGVGQSVPSIHCVPGYANGVRPPYEPVTKSIENSWLRLSIGYAAACGANNGEILQHMTTVDAAKDMDAIRVALGANQINYYGFSYGTYLGQVYGTLFPSHLRRVVFDGTVDPRKIWYQANLDQDVAFEKTITVWFGWLAKYDSVYHLGNTTKKVELQYYKQKIALSKHPVGDVGGSEWNDMLLYAGYYQSVWLDLADVFSKWAVNHDAAALQAGYENFVAADDDNGFAVYSAVQCTDAKWPSTYASYRSDNWKTFVKAPFETWGNAWFNAPCLTWPVAAGTPLPIDGSKIKSELMINETLDAATPYPGSLEVRKRFPGASLIAEPGGTTHAGSLYGDACVDDKIAAYLADGTLPTRKPGNAADVYCAPLPQPDPTATSDASLFAVTSTARPSVTELRLKALGGLPG